MKRLPALLVLGVLALVSAASRPDRDSHRMAVEELFEVLDMERAHNAGMEQMLAIQVQQNPQIGFFRDVNRRFFEKHMSWESLKDEFISVFMEEFSEDEIRELTAFYKTPTGKKTVRKLPVLMARGSRLQARLMRENMPELERMIREAEAGASEER